jgi:hypothetical protein
MSPNELINLINCQLRLFKRTGHAIDYPLQEWIRLANNQASLERFHERLDRHFSLGNHKAC